MEQTLQSTPAGPRFIWAGGAIIQFEQIAAMCKTQDVLIEDVIGGVEQTRQRLGLEVTLINGEVFNFYDRTAREFLDRFDYANDGNNPPFPTAEDFFQAS